MNHRSWHLYQALLFILPLPFAGVFPWGWGVFSLLAFISLGLSLASSSTRPYSIDLPENSVKLINKSRPVIYLLLLAQCLVLLQTLLFDNRHDSYQHLIMGLSLTAFFVLTLIQLNSRDRIKQAIWVVIIAGSLQALYGSIMVMTGLEWGAWGAKTSYIDKATGTFVNRNSLAGYLEMTLALGIGFLLSQTTRYRGRWQQRLRQFIQMLLSSKVIMRLLLAVMVIGLVMTRSRMGNTAFFASLMIAGGLALLLMKNKSVSTTILLSSLLIIDVAIVGTFFGVDKVAERLQGTSIEKESRDEVSRDTFNMWLDNPILGTGAGSYQYSYPSYRSADVTTDRLYDYAHNDYLQFLAEFGTLATLLLLLAVLLCFYWGVQAMRLRRDDLFKGLGFAGCMAIVAIAIHSLVDFNLQIPANAFMFVFMLAIACIARWSDSGRGGQRRRRTRS
ncbi:MAG: O-antigen ligase family protein [Oleispira sp.]|nr:O-antigen ligase family protein [Oleispira sp.]